MILGPTGVGKTELTLRLAEIFNVPVINADSRQIFSEIPIGTAAPTPEQLARAEHFFVGNHHLSDYYSASLYEADALEVISEQHTRGNLALMSGGSMMYIDAVCNGIDDIPTVDDATRTLMKQRLASEGLPKLVEELHQLDPEHWAIVDHNNPRRVVRKERPFRILKIGLTLPREQLYERINHRVEQMIEQGLVAEARRVYPLRNLNSLNTVGYKELFAHFDGDYDLAEAVRRIQSNSRRYARKQQTWFKRDASIAWFQPSQLTEIEQYINHFVNP